MRLIGTLVSSVLYALAPVFVAGMWARRKLTRDRGAS